MISKLTNLHSGCRFCTMTRTEERAVWDTVLDSDGTVEVVPSKGAIVSPWLLLIPSSHVPSSAMLSVAEKQSVARLIDDIRRKACIAGKHLVVFENGSPYFGSGVSCGIDHVHIHMVALDFNLARTLQERLPLMPASAPPWSIWSEIPEKPYIYIDDGEEHIYLDASYSVSQYVRSVVAELAGRSGEFHYDLFPDEDNVIHTIDWFNHLSSGLSVLSGRDVA